MSKAIKVAITGAAGQIGYSLIFRIASGQMLGNEQKIILQLLDVEPALNVLKGVQMELDDCAFPLLESVIITTDPKIAFADCDVAVLVGAKPRSKGMERSDLLAANGAIFSQQGQALSEVAKKTVRVLVVGNPANTNALIAMHHAKNLTASNFSAMMRLDHNRALAQLAQKVNVPTSVIRKIIVWGNHSLTQYPDLAHAEINGQKAVELVEQNWLTSTFIPTVQKRGAAVIEARGLSSAASAASAAIDHLRNWLTQTPTNDFVSMAVMTDGSYNIPAGIVYGFPTVCNNGNYSIVQNLTINDFARQALYTSYNDLLAERDAIRHLL